MNFARYIQKNLAWNFNKDTFDALCCEPTTERQLTDQLRRLADRYFPQHKRMETLYTEFCMNEIALSRPKTDAEKCVRRYFGGYWQTFLRLKATFGKEYMLFPADGKHTRLEYIARLVACCTQFAVSRETIARICQTVREIFDLEERESRNLENAIDLWQINFYCAAARGVADGEAKCKMRLAKMFDELPLKTEYELNTHLAHTYFSSKQLVANVDCFANSATKFTCPTAVDVRASFFVNGNNVFDTFCESKFGCKTAQFRSVGQTLAVEMQYFVDANREIRRFWVQNRGQTAKKLVTDFSLRHFNPGCKTAYFEASGALCLSVADDEDFYCALAIVEDNKPHPCPFEEGRLSAMHRVEAGQTLHFDLVTVFAENMPQLSDALSELFCFGSTRCPHLTDTASQNVARFKTPLSPTMHGHMARTAPQKEADVFHFTYQLGDENVGTFLDNAGNGTTLLNGFAFGVGGEKVYSVKYGKMSQLNCNKFALQADGVTYTKPAATCTAFHDGAKNYLVEYPTPARTLFYFPFEEKCSVTMCGNTFEVKGSLRSFCVECGGKIESFTTNALECNPERLRYKLSGETECGSCLAICLGAATTVQLKISSHNAVAKARPLVRESLLSTYLNYINGKNVFCLNNYLKRADSLTLAAITYTNPQFVRDYIANVWGKNNFFYDAGGRKRQFCDRLALPLAIVYLAQLADRADFPTTEMKSYAAKVMFANDFVGRDLCIKALLLKKASHTGGFDRVQCLIEYNNVKRQISSNSNLLAYAQAIGALPMPHPTKEKLRDLCNKMQVPKSWYYVSQLENLYGMSLVEGALQFAPKVSQENVLEQLTLNIRGKRIDTSFLKSAVQSMTLNGNKYDTAFSTDSLKSCTNTLVVRY